MDIMILVPFGIKISLISFPSFPIIGLESGTIESLFALVTRSKSVYTRKVGVQNNDIHPRRREVDWGEPESLYYTVHE
jgi:hypothetical protein